MALEVGKKFSSYRSFEQALKKFEDWNYVKFYKKRSCKIEAIKPRVKYPIKSELEFFEIDLHCIRGGPFVKLGSAIRNCSTFKVDCPASMSLRVTPDGQYLELKSLNNMHNHATLKEERLSEDVRQKTGELFHLTADSKPIYQKYQTESGRVLSLNDLSNIKVSSPKPPFCNMPREILSLKDKHDADIEVFEKDRKSIGIFFQTQNMKHVFAAFPEYIAIDATCKFSKLKMTIYIVLVEDGNCDSEIVAFGILSDQILEAVDWFFSVLKSKNLECEKTSHILTAKSLTEKCVFKNYFPNADLLLCIFHMLRTFSEEISFKYHQISVEERIACLEFLQNMQKSETEEEFEQNLQLFNEIAPDSVKDFYYKNWHYIRTEWCSFADFRKSNFLNSTNNRVEFIYSKLKSSLKGDSVISVVKDIFVHLKVLEAEKKLAAVQMVQKKIVMLNFIEAENPEFAEILTPGAFMHVSKHLTASKCSEFVMKTADSENFQIMTDKGFVMASINSCNCSFFLSMQLPCQHIFMVRRKLHLPLFDKSLINRRWTKKYLLWYLKIYEEQNDDGAVCDITSSQLGLENVQNKVQHVKEITDKIADLLSAMDTGNFDANMKLLKAYKDLLLQQKSMCINQQYASTSEETDKIYNVPQIDINFDGLNFFETDSFSEMGYLKNSPSPMKEAKTSKLSRYCEHEATLLSDATVTSSFNPEEATGAFYMRKGRKSPSPAAFDSEPETSSLIGFEDRNDSKADPLKRISETSLGLLQKKRRLKAHFIFSSLPTEEKVQSIIECFINKERCRKSHVKKIREVDLEKNIQNIPNKVLEMIKMVDINLLKKHFTDDAWRTVEYLISEKEKNAVLICPICSKNIIVSSIPCESCLEYFHLKCVGLKIKPIKRKWVCIKCLFATD